MASWFKKIKKGNTTKTMSSKGATISRSVGSKTLRVTTTMKPGGKTYKTTTQRVGGWTKITRKKT